MQGLFCADCTDSLFYHRSKNSWTGNIAFSMIAQIWLTLYGHTVTFPYVVGNPVWKGINIKLCFTFIIYYFTLSAFSPYFHGYVIHAHATFSISAYNIRHEPAHQHFSNTKPWFLNFMSQKVFFLFLYNSTAWTITWTRLMSMQASQFSYCFYSNSSYTGTQFKTNSNHIKSYHISLWCDFKDVSGVWVSNSHRAF